MEQNLVQSCITSVGFPETIEELWGMIEKHRYSYQEDWMTDLDSLLKFDSTKFGGMAWTAARWMTQGDILFFYHSKRGSLRIPSLLKQAQKEKLNSGIIKLLERNKALSKLYAGKIFACSLITGTTEYSEKQPEYHFDSRFFAPFEKVHIFENPVDISEFAEYIKIQQNAVTPVYRKHFEGIKRLLEKNNKLPGFLKNAEFGDLTFHSVNETNWHKISTLPKTKFINEAQIRAYLFDFFLAKLKDKGTSLSVECECFRDGEKTGIVDYFIKIAGTWIPVEAKLNILTEKNLDAQLAKYIGVDSFKPTIGTNKGMNYIASSTNICLVVDQSGVYIYHKDKFVDCDYNKPVWRRENLSPDTVTSIQQKISCFL